MNSSFSIDVIETHTAGEPTRIITEGVELELGEGTVREKREQFAAEHDEIRRLLMQEPRGHSDMYGAVVLEPSRSDTDFGVFFMDGGGYVDMCGHAIIGIVTAFVETGRLKQKSEFKIETPSGTVFARPEMDGNSVVQVAFENVESFVVGATSVQVITGNHDRTIPVDLVYSGNVFALVQASEVGLQICPETAGQFQQLGREIQRNLNEKMVIEHPFEGTSHEVSVVEFYEPSDPDRNIVIYGEQSQIDRSPCGSGTCAKVTYLYENGMLELGEPYLYQSVIGTTFEGKVLDTTSRDEVQTVKPRVAGAAYITAEHTFYKDSKDPLDGFSV